MSNDEQRLVERAIGGDRSAFNELVQRHQGAVYRACARYSGQEAADLTQETFMRAFVHRERFDATRPVLPWLLTIARHLCIDRSRKHKPLLAVDDTPVDMIEPRPGAEESFAAREQITRLKQAHAQLAEGPREAIALYHWESLSYDEIAKTLGVPIGTVMTWLHRGRAQLRKALSEPIAAGGAA